MLTEQQVRAKLDAINAQTKVSNTDKVIRKTLLDVLQLKAERVTTYQIVAAA